jgi:hypothetical protein
MVVVLAVSSGTTRVTSQQQAPQEKTTVGTLSNTSLIQRYDKAVRKVQQLDTKIHPPKCNVGSAKQYTVKKRLATWGWQKKIFVPRTRTNYAERTTHACGYLKYLGRTWAGRADYTFRRYVELQDPEEAICHVFGNYCSQALRVSACESGHAHSVNAHNGQYLGMFQMGSSERATYGHGATPLEQAMAAYRYFVASGKDWSPWSCKPW